MVDINYNDYGVAAALNNMAEAQQMQAMRPQKSRVYTSTTSTPRELEDMIVRRNMIGAATRELDDALKARESYKYSLGTALAGLPQQQGPGSWLSAFARSFGAGMAAPTAAQVDRAQKKYEAEIKDLNTAIALDKAMGETQGQEQTIGYDELPYGLGGGKGGKGGDNDGGIASYLDLQDIDIDKLNKDAGSWETNEYNPSDQNQSWLKGPYYSKARGEESDYGVALAKKTPRANSMEKFNTMAMQGMFDVLKYLRPATDTDVLVSLSTAGADPKLTPEVRDMRLTKTLNGELRKGGLAPVNNLRHWVDTVRYLKQTGEWNPQAVLQQQKQGTETKQTEQSKKKIKAGDVIDGWRFKGGANIKENWEKVE